MSSVIPHRRTAHRPGPPDASAARGPRAVDAIGVILLLLAGPVLLHAAAVLATADPGSAGGSLVRVLGLGAALAGATLLLWWTVGLAGLAITVLGHRTGHAAWARLGARLTPAILRRVGAAVLGAQLLGSPAAWADAPPAQAPSVSASWTAGTTAAPPTVAGAGLPDAGWTPRAPQTAPPGGGAAQRPTTDRPTVTVRAGDCLWDIAARELGPDATPREIDRRWRDWHRENAAAIGPDPDVIVPGTVLTAPAFSPYLADDAETRP